MEELQPQISFEDFLKVDIRVGEIKKIEEFPRARKPSYRIEVDFGEEVGVKQSSIQAKKDYEPGQLVGMQVIAVVNFPPKNIAGFMSEVLVLGVPAADGELSILTPSIPAKIGGRMY